MPFIDFFGPYLLPPAKFSAHLTNETGTDKAQIHVVISDDQIPPDPPFLVLLFSFPSICLNKKNKYRGRKANIQ